MNIRFTSERDKKCILDIKTPSCWSYENWQQRTDGIVLETDPDLGPHVLPVMFQVMRM